MINNYYIMQHKLCKANEITVKTSI